MANAEKESQLRKGPCSSQQTIPILSGNTILQHDGWEIIHFCSSVSISNIEISECRNVGWQMSEVARLHLNNCSTFNREVGLDPYWHKEYVRSTKKKKKKLITSLILQCFLLHPYRT